MEKVFQICIIWLVKIQIPSNIAKGVHMASTVGADILSSGGEGNGNMNGFLLKLGGFWEKWVVFFFRNFFNLFHFVEISRMHYFKFFNSILTKNPEIDSSFLRIFYLFIFKISKLTHRVLLNR
jgi:hypothetical protein